ncbi:Inosine-uridine preferring nucleoside hydrolase [Ancylostoma ceylanicum]|uniref:Inosine-uridine preferring nucleoside hydrolase n=1 Tax=Ancylostoma ceylanicum TaxID=53326 RepID=A0A0D6LGP9_9BILA|nr:Inosine-uridine preferring nucleoside hydrolase [Ancylostoma ceylanicum]
MKKKLIIDTDGVSDDMRAISLAIQHPDVEVIAITTVHGCVPVDKATANVARVQRANGVEGASEALIRKPFVVHPFFGIDGIGDRPDVFPEVSPSDFTAHDPECAALALIRLTKEYEDVTVVCLGPLTNIALAYKLDSNLPQRIKRLVIMGGNYYGVGNVDEFSSAEFNFNGDPEAAKIVIEEMHTDVTLVPWENVYLKGAESEISVKHEAEVDFDAHLKVDTPLSSFLAVATHIAREVMGTYGRQYAYCDEVAVAVAIDEKAVAKRTMDLRMGVEVHGQMTRGQVVVDWAGALYGPDGAVTDARIVKDSDKTRRKVHVIADYNVKIVDEWMHNTVRRKSGPW